MTSFPPLFMVAPGGFFGTFGDDGMAAGAGIAHRPLARYRPRDARCGARGSRPGRGRSTPRARPSSSRSAIASSGRQHASRAAERYEQALRATRARRPLASGWHRSRSSGGDTPRPPSNTGTRSPSSPDWLARAGDIQSVYGEPGDFARQIARLQRHLQVGTERPRRLVRARARNSSYRAERRRRPTSSSASRTGGPTRPSRRSSTPRRRRSDDPWPDSHARLRECRIGSTDFEFKILKSSNLKISDHEMFSTAGFVGERGTTLTSRNREG